MTTGEIRIDSHDSNSQHSASNLHQSNMDKAYRRSSLHAWGDSSNSRSTGTETWEPKNLPISAFSPPVISSSPTDNTSSTGIMQPSGSDTSTTASSLSRGKCVTSVSEAISNLNTDPTSSLTDLSQKERDSSSYMYDRTYKVAKMHLKDHGEHNQNHENKTQWNITAQSILKKVTCGAKDTFGMLVQEDSLDDHNLIKVTKNRVSSHDMNALCNNDIAKSTNNNKTTTTAPSMLTSQKALSKSDLDPACGDTAGMVATSCITPISTSANPPAQYKGLLHTALQEGRDHEHKQGKRPRGKCLTSPSEPASNDGLDNAEGNLIVCENDIIQTPIQNTYKKPSGTTSASLEPSKNKISLQVVSLLGQGTFAQVFKCKNLETGQLVALKVVKNKPAYTRQAVVEVNVFAALAEPIPVDSNNPANSTPNINTNGKYMVKLLNYFMHTSHLCLIFELLGLNLYEVLKRRQFRGLSLQVVRILLSQSLEGAKELSAKSIVHCDLKPENILLVNNAQLCNNQKTRVSNVAHHQLQADINIQKIKLIDFGSASFEGDTAHTYIQSRFYRSPEVLIGLPYDSAIDIWSLGCVAAEIFLGLPILPGVHEHDQLGRICEMIGFLPDKMLDEGTKSTKYFCKYFPKATAAREERSEQKRSPLAGLIPPSPQSSTSPKSPPRPAWRLKTQKEYITSLSVEESREKGGKAKLEKQPTNRYFKRKRLSEIVMLHGSCSSSEDKESLGLFVHLLSGILDPDPWKRWTAYQASTHPFITGSKLHRRKKATTTTTTHAVITVTEGGREEDTKNGNSSFDIYWVPPWDPSICRRRLLNVQKTRERQQALLRASRDHTPQQRDYVRTPLVESDSSVVNGTARVTDMTDAMSLSQHSLQPKSAPGDIFHAGRGSSPPISIGGAISTPVRHRHPHSQCSPTMFPPTYLGSLGTAVGSTNQDPGRMLSNLQPSPYFSASSLKDFNPGIGHRQLHSAMMQMSPSMHAIAAAGRMGDSSLGQQMPITAGPQSFSGLGYETYNPHLPTEGVGYALQRPGVVPGLGGNVPNMVELQCRQPITMPTGYSPHQIPMYSAHHGGFMGASSSVGRNTSRQMIHTQQSQCAMHNLYMLSSTSIQEDVSDYSSTGFTASLESRQQRSSSNNSAIQTTSLLAQQMSEHSAATPQCALQNQMHAISDPSNIQQHSVPGTDGSTSHPAVVPPNYQMSPAMYSSSGFSSAVSTASQHPNGSYYIAANIIPTVMSGPSVHIPSMSAAFGGSYDQTIPIHGSYSHQHMGAGGTAAVVPTSHMTQDSFDKIQYFQVNGFGAPSPPRPPPPYRGMSM